MNTVKSLVWERLKRQKENLRTCPLTHEKVHAVGEYLKEILKHYTCHDCTGKDSCNVDLENSEDVKKSICTMFQLEAWEE